VEHNNNNSDANEYFLDSGAQAASPSLSSTFTPRQSWRISSSHRGRSGGGRAVAVDQNRGDNDVTRRRQSWMPPNSYSSTTDNLNHNSNSSNMLSLRDLLQQKDIFAKSWSEPDRREIRRRRRDGDDFVYDNYYHVNTTTRRQRGLGGGDYNEQYRMSPTDVEMAATVVSTITKCDTINDNNNQQQQQLSMLLTPIEIEYNTLLQQTESLLLSLSSSESSSTSSYACYDHSNNTSSQSIAAATLQQMDFDNVMMKWSRLHTISDNNNEFNSMKCNASDQCLRLLHALENNYDCILDSCLLSLSSSTTSSATNKNNNHPRHRHIIPNATSNTTHNGEYEFK
jgi:hypothetical protein